MYHHYMHTQGEGKKRMFVQKRVVMCDKQQHSMKTGDSYTSLKVSISSCLCSYKNSLVMYMDI